MPGYKSSVLRIWPSKGIYRGAKIIVDGGPFSGVQIIIMTNATPTESVCSCGSTEAHVVARRKTFDDISVQFWSDGAVTCGINTYVAMAPRSAFRRRAAVKANWLVTDRVSLYDHAELRGMVDAAREAMSQTGHLPGAYLDAKLRGVKFQACSKGAVLKHSLDCGCAACIARREAIRAVPESDRVYIGIDLANGSTSYVRVK